jgi:hypothetical protein
MADESEGGSTPVAPEKADEGPATTEEPAAAPEPEEPLQAAPEPSEAAGSSSGGGAAPADAAAAPAAESGAAATPPPSGERGVLRLRGIPFAANESNIFQFFEGAESIQQPLEVYICRRNGEQFGRATARWVCSPRAASCQGVRRRGSHGHSSSLSMQCGGAVHVCGTPALLARLGGASSRMLPRGFAVAADWTTPAAAAGPPTTNAGRSTGECYVVLPTAEDAASARQQLDKRHIGHRYIE